MTEENIDDEGNRLTRRTFVKYTAGAVGLGVGGYAASRLAAPSALGATAPTKAVTGATAASPVAAQTFGKNIRVPFEIKPEEPLRPPGIMPVIVISGSDYEMGYQYGMQAAPWIYIRKNAAWAFRLSYVWYPPITYDETVLWMKRHQYYVSQYTPECIDYMKGIAQGCTDAGYDVKYEDILLINLYWAFMPAKYNIPPDKDLENLPPKGKRCSAFSAWGSTTKDGKLICGSCGDIDFDYNLTIIAFPDGGRNSWIGTVMAGELVDQPGMNSKGVYIAIGGCFPETDEENVGLTEQFSAYHILNSCNTATEAKDFLLGSLHPGAENWQIDDVYGNHWVAELTKDKNVARTAGDVDEVDFLYKTNNCMSPDMEDHHPTGTFIHPGVGWQFNSSTNRSSVWRNKLLYTMFTQYHGLVDLDFASMMWRFNGDNDPENPAGYTRKLGCDVNDRLGVAIPGSAGDGKIWLCAGPLNVIHLPNSMGWLTGGPQEYAHEFYKLDLASSIEGIYWGAWGDALSAFNKAAWRINKIPNTDIRYQHAQQLTGLSRAEFFDGVNWHNAAVLSTGNEALLYNSKSLTALVNSQIHGKQAYNMFVPPPDDPTDLGLDPYEETAW